MKPSQVAQVLCRIASKIQNSNQPDKRLVAKDLKRVLAAVEPFVTVTLQKTVGPNRLDHIKQW